jgi:hypothetical protein
MNQTTAPKHKKRHRGGRKHRKNRSPITSSAPSTLVFSKKHDQVAAIRADQIAEGRRMMSLDPDA